MKAMVLAAGLGTRLRPLTDDRPKALVEVAGKTMLEIVLERLRSFEIREVIVNAHHFGGQIAAYLKENRDFGMRIEISYEEILLDTGGGLKKAAPFFLAGAAGLDQPFILHNVDVISAIDLRRMIQAHQASGALATLAVQERETSRYLLFDEQMQLRGRRSGSNANDELVAASTRAVPLAFCGIHVISPRIFSLMTEQGAFSIIDVYLRLAAAREKVMAFRADEYYWRDLGKPEQVEKAARDLRRGVLQ
ncbi:MAG: nucleotidyltransferase family protein [Acidobacteriota bacterium]|nr:nucleotidyltransferase family protein [Acidobacteriota bacterium]